ncbi:hypothetical protein WJX73_010266 [Symbiochloris irregularis]|uniref:Uncharacterized protein n=1 Tax=Symbiochloris irregularis TaxID=706552 RepID=A0AAW1NRL3_9CHLO
MLDEELDHSATSSLDALSDEEDDSFADSDSSDILLTNGDALAKKAKKKKKKKKKKPQSPTAASELPADQSAAKTASKAENEARFNAAVKSVVSNDEDLLWMRLDGCNVHENKTRKLAQALGKNKHLTSLDLSGNQINNDAIRELVEALENGAAPELIFLDVRNNPFGVDGEDALESLQRSRKQLRVEVKAAEPDSGPEGDSAKAGSESGTANGDQGADWALNQENEGSMNQMNRSMMYYAIAPYFQVPGEGRESVDNIPTDPSTVAKHLWDEVSYGYHETPSNIPRMGAALHAIVQCCDDELLVYAHEQPPMGAEESGFSSPYSRGTESLRPHGKAALKNLKLCRDVLKVESPEILTPFSRGWKHPTVGTHRMAVAEVVARLLSIGDSSIDSAVSELQLVASLVRLCLDRPHCSALQTMCLRILRLALDSTSHALWSPLLQPNMGATSSGDPDQPQESRPSLQRFLALVCESSRGQKPGVHSPDVGFAIACAEILKSRYDTIHHLMDLERDHPNWAGDQHAAAHHENANRELDPSSKANSVRAPANVMENGMLLDTAQRLLQLLDADEAWQDFAQPEGRLDDLLSQADGELCGPRPARGMYGSSPMMTGQVLPSTHSFEEGFSEDLEPNLEPNGHDGAQQRGAEVDSETNLTQLQEMLQDFSVVKTGTPANAPDLG